MREEEEEAERRFCFLNDRAGCGGVEYAAGLLEEVWARPRFAIELIYERVCDCSWLERNLVRVLRLVGDVRR